MEFGLLLETYFSSDVYVQFTMIFQLYYKHALLISLVKVMLNIRTSHFSSLQSPHYHYLGS